MLFEFTKSEIKQFYRLARSVTEVASGFAITSRSPKEGRETLIIPKRLPVTPDSDDPIDLTTPFCSDRVSELLRAYQAHQFLDEVSAAALRFGTHWRSGRRSMFQIEDPLKASHLQILFLQEKPSLSSGWMDLSSDAEEKLRRLSDFHYTRTCPDALILHGFIIPCDHLSEPVQFECSQEWQSIYQ